MSTNPIKIIEALIERLEGEGYSVTSGKVVDPRQHDLPLIGVHYGSDGRKTVQGRFPKKCAIQFALEYYFEIETDHALIEAEEKAQSLEDVVIQRPPRDAPDTLDGLADSVEHQKTQPISQPEESKVGVVDMTILVTYYDEE